MNSEAAPTVWATATSRNESTGRAIIFRFVKEFGKKFERHRQPVRAILAWKYETETGMPSYVERQRMDLMEDALAETLEKSGFATLALVSTGEGLREWTYYAGSESEFFALLNQGLSAHAAYPINIHISEDPQWSMYNEFRQDVVE
jgi:Family of unknown function (DUF695)